MAILAGLTVLLAACDYYQAEEGSGMEQTELCPDEVEFLSGIYVNEERLKEGALLSYQKDTLERYRFGKNYLNQKYPDYEFEILFGDPATKFTPYANFTFQEQDGEETYSLYIYKEEETDAYYGEDNFYGHIFAETYDACLRETFRSVWPAIYGVHSSMPWVKGEEYGQDLQPEDIWNGRLRLSALTDIYVCGSQITDKEAETMAEKLREQAMELGAEGSFKIYVTDVEIADLAAGRRKPDKGEYRLKKTFQTYEEE